MDDKIKVLFLPRWYPNRYDPMPGLFIQRQAEALTQFCQVAVVYIHPDANCPNKFEVDFAVENEVRVLRVYFNAGAQAGILAPIFNMVRYYRAAMRAVKSIRQFEPQIVHAHVLTRIGFVAWRVSRKMNVPFIISEHWSRYFPENNSYHGFIRRSITRLLVNRAAALIPVSEILKKAMKEQGLDNKLTRVVPNVVETALFTPREKTERKEIKTMIHVSCFDDRSKNISGLLRALKSLSLKRRDFQCWFVGEGPDYEAMRRYAGELEIIDTFAVFKGGQEPGMVAEIMADADFAVLSSHYETFGTVLVESLSCGIPVVASNTGIAGEIIHEGNGMLVKPGDEGELTLALNGMLDRCRTFSTAGIRATLPDHYSENAVAMQMKSIYDKVLKNNGKKG